MKRKSQPSGDTEEDEEPKWERIRQQAVQHATQQQVLHLPVRVSRAAEDGGWGEAKPACESAESAVPHVAGITVVDDLVVAWEQRQRLEEQEQQVWKAKQAEQRRQGAAQMRTEGAEALLGIQSRELRLQAAKQQLAAAAQQLLQDPETKGAQLRTLLELLRDEDAQICRLAMLTLLAVFKDLIPTYRIRPVDAPSEKLSKDVQGLRTYEGALLNSYHTYLKGLVQAYKASTTGQAPLQQARIAVKCMAGLLEAAPHFNYRSDLLRALVACLPHKDQQIREIALAGLSALLASNQGDGEVVTEAVQLIADLVRRWNCIVPPTTLECLLVMRFQDITALPPTGDGQAKKIKRQRKGQDEVEREFKEAQAAIDLETRRANQTATLDALFEMLFRVFKHCSSSGLIQQEVAAPMSRQQFSKRFPLLFPALRLLSKFVHLISVEYIQDIAAELRRLLNSSMLPPHECLRVLLTAAEMMQRQSNAKAMEHVEFYKELYVALKHTMLVPLLEAQGRSQLPGQLCGVGGVGDSSSEDCKDDELLDSLLANDEHVDTKAGEQVCYLLPQVLEAQMLDTRAFDATRQAAFAKRMLAAAVSAGDTGLSMGLLCLLRRMLRCSRRLQAMLQHEAGGSSTQTYRPEVDDPAEAGALAAPMWELHLLAQHYHPHVAGASAHLAAGSPAATLPLAGSTAAFSLSYSTISGGFIPTPNPLGKRN